MFVSNTGGKTGNAGIFSPSGRGAGILYAGYFRIYDPIIIHIHNNTTYIIHNNPIIIIHNNHIYNVIIVYYYMCIHYTNIYIYTIQVQEIVQLNNSLYPN